MPVAPRGARRVATTFPIMFARDCIERKRDGRPLSPDEWARLMRAYAAGEVPDYQMAALAMAVWFRGMDDDETSALTAAMLASGGRLDFAHLAAPRIDKHSTGGVGDKTSLILAPLLAACGVAVPMMSGRGLGHTGGTLDKLEAIPGFRTDLSLDRARAQVEALGCALIGQTGEIAPADRKLYALRDATGTVESIPLIAASIMSKKLAEGLTGLVLDVKRGSGAFLPELERGLELTRRMVALGGAHGVPVVALLTAMDRPLGRACGNALEVEEAIMVLKGEGPPDLTAVTVALGLEMLLLGGVARDVAEARTMLARAIASGRAAERFEQVIAAQGGDAAVVNDPGRLPQAAAVELFRADRDGVVLEVRPREVGRGITAMGGGRSRVEDVVDPSVGFVISARPGDPVRAGEPLATVFARDAVGIAAGTSALRVAIRLGEGVAETLPLVSHRVTAAGVEVLAQD
jgi:pyrimidine-nucleoside phosphorylase